MFSTSELPDRRFQGADDLPGVSSASAPAFAVKPTWQPSGYPSPPLLLSLMVTITIIAYGCWIHW